LVVKLIENGADLNVKDQVGFTPLHLLCQYYDKDNLVQHVLFFLVEKGAYVNAKDIRFGLKPIQSLCRNYSKDNMMELIRFLVGKGANVSGQTENGRIPF